MKISKLYRRILLSFIIALFVTMIGIFALFIHFSGKDFMSHFEAYASNIIINFKEIVEQKIDAAPDTKLSQNKALHDFINDFSKVLKIKVWLEEGEGAYPLKSFGGTIPDVAPFLKHPEIDRGSFKLYHSFRRHASIYAVIPIRLLNGEQGSIHVLFEKGPEGKGQGGGFLLGLVLLGGIVAILIIPVSRSITKSLNKLRESALRLADGDLSHRADIKCKDEIGELGATFNHMADQMERMIRGGRELTANISHELRTPLARIRIATQLLTEQFPQEQGRWSRYLNDIHEDIEELDHLIGRILDLSKLDIHETPFKKETFDLIALIKGLLDRQHALIDQKGLQVKAELEGSIGFKGDKEALEMALSNIVGNAVKFTPEKGSIAATAALNPAGILVSVTNTSGPLSEDDLSKIFEPFHRLAGNKTKGSGLGLTITKKIIEKHGGTVKARNTPQGLQIRMTLPAPPGK